MVGLRRWGPRIAAPAAFLLGITVAVMLVRAGMSDDGGAATVARTAPTVATTATTGTTATRPRPRRAFTRVQGGDTLDQIAIEHDTTVERLLELNPGLDPNGLQIGQRIRVR